MMGVKLAFLSILGMLSLKSSQSYVLDTKEAGEGPEVVWQGIPMPLTVNKHNIGTKLMVTPAQLLKKHYSSLRTELFNGDLYFFLKKIDNMSQPRFNEQMESAVVSEFRTETIRKVTKNELPPDCGARIEDGKIQLMHCPGKLIVLTLVSAEELSCRKVNGMKVFGPVLLRNERCNQQLISLLNCAEALNYGYLKGGCKVIKETKIGQTGMIIMLVASLVFWLMTFSICLFLMRMRKWTKNFNTTLKSNGLEIEQFLGYDSKAGVIVYKEKPSHNQNIDHVLKKFNWRTLIFAILCFKPLNIDAYDLVETQVISDNQFKYTISLSTSESIQVGSMEIKFASPTMEARLSPSFTTYAWDLVKYETYYCQQSNCNTKMVCREDILPFTKMTNPVREEFKVKDSDYAFASCKNMIGYCAFGNGCLMLGVSLELKEENKHEVFSIGYQEQTDGEVVLPPGCYLDSHEQSKIPSMEGMFFVESNKKEGWFCHPNLYSHHPLPNSLGDIKVGKNRTLNFISEHIYCATDSWRSVFCMNPESFIKSIDKYCIKNTIDNIGYKIERESEVLKWHIPSEETLKITCDRDLKLHNSLDHCYDVDVHVWDTRNNMNDLMITVSAKSTSRKGIFKFPKSIHMESHIFPCDGLLHNTLLYDLKSLNSTGIKFSYHTNIKDLQPEDYQEGTVISPEDNSWYFDGIPTWADRTVHWFTGVSLTTLLIVGLVIVCLLKR